jgi:HEAT repeat protein
VSNPQEVFVGPDKRNVVVGIALAVGAAGWLVAAPVDVPRLREAARAGNWQAVQAMGTAVLPELARLYSESSVDERARIAQVYYNLGWKSEDARRALMADAHTADSSLRLQVQWALGRVSDDPAVVDVLLDNMRNDPEPLFRDKAACALAYDQVHLAPAQKLRLFEGLVGALDDPKLQVRQVAIQALSILTHQTKGFAPSGDAPARGAAVAAWRRWLDEYRANL